MFAFIKKLLVHVGTGFAVYVRNVLGFFYILDNLY